MSQEIENAPISREIVMVLRQKLGGIDESNGVKAYCILTAALAEVLAVVPETLADELIRDLSHQTYETSRRFRALNQDLSAKLAALVNEPAGRA